MLWIRLSPTFLKHDILQILSEGKWSRAGKKYWLCLIFKILQVFRTAVGASGVIYGIIVAFVFMFPNAELAFNVYSGSYQS
jgi:hypothetical protein